MKNITILPADTYTVINKTIITDNDKKYISMLYQPIIGFTAVSLYYTLINDLDKLEVMSDELTHHHLMNTMQLRLEDIVEARERLEAIGLLKTYYKKDSINNYVYLLFSPMSPGEFFNHPILNIVLYNNLGKNEYEKILNYYKVPKINLKDYDDITKKFNEVYKSCVGNPIEIKEEILKRTNNEITIDDNIDFNMIISSIKESRISDKCFNKETRLLINQLSVIYNINTLQMQRIINSCINEKGLIDKQLLRKSCREYYQFENNGNLPTLIYNKQPEFLKKPEGENTKWAKMVYTFENLTPYQFLKAKYKGAEPTDRDKKLIEKLMIDQKLKPGVINVLIAYVLKVNNEQLNKNYVETIAGQWKRLNIETVEEAMQISEKHHKKVKKMIDDKKKTKPTNKHKDKEASVPIWFNDNNDVEEISEEEKDELNKLLEELI